MAIEIGMIVGPVLNYFAVGRLPCREIIGWVGIALMVGGITLRYRAGWTLDA